MGGGGGGGLGVKFFFFKFNQIWCVSYLHEWHMQRHHFLKSISKVFKPNFVYLLTNGRYLTYQKGFSFGRLGHAPGVGLRGTVGGLGGQKICLFFFKIQPDLVCELLT